jgi:periplasmic copper chaperone A
MTRSVRSILRVGTAIGAMAAVLALATPASAHVEAAGETAPDGLTTVTFGFSHGCTGSATTSLKVKVPDGTTDVTAQNPTGWSSTVDGSQLTWTGGPIADQDTGSFTATMRLVGTKGETVYLPTVQGCQQGEDAWIELTPDPEADNAAPRIVLAETVSVTGTATSIAGVTTPTSAASASDAVAARDAQIVHESENSPIGVIVIIAVVALIVITAAILYLRNRRPSTP